MKQLTVPMLLLVAVSTAVAFTSPDKDQEYLAECRHHAAKEYIPESQTKSYLAQCLSDLYSADGKGSAQTKSDPKKTP